MNIFEVGQPEFEASLEIMRQSLTLLDVPLTKIYELTDELRQQYCSTCRIENLPQSLLANIRKTPFLLEMSWFEVTKNNITSGKSIGDLAVRSKTGASIVGIFRNNELIPNPDSKFIFQDGDLIAIIGLPKNKKMFENMITT